ncbi:MAG: glycosyltransferase family 4 protein [Bdellovibrionales bacterium]|jgi:glycosyltransferase involved in cell wall biosynthesis
MSIAIHYTSTKPHTGNEREVFGLQVAIADLLKAYMRHARAEKLSFLIGSEEEQKELQLFAAQAGVDEKRLVMFDRRFPEKNLLQFSTIFRAEPDTRNVLWQRNFTGSFNFCGLAHAISGTEAGTVLQDYCLSPSENTDAILCPSHAVKSAIRAFWDSYAEYLSRRFGAAYRCPVQLPVIPLGVECEKFEAKATPEKRALQRQLLGVKEKDIVLLWVGRLSAAIKAHPLAMFQAAERAASLSGTKVHLVMVGYFVPLEAEAQFKKLAAAVCTEASVTFIAANDPRYPDGLWAAGDIFLSLIDNMQESFGLTPIEAMAAGLPRVVSDWDGYRDCVTDGEDGYLIRTTQPPAGNGFDLTTEVLNEREMYGGFLAKTALTVAVDAQQAGDRLAALIADKNLRLSMAQKAKERVRAVYDWKNIIPAYENLWKELESQRKAGAAKTSKQRYSSALPQLPDPYTMYAGYPSATLKESNRLSLAASNEQIKVLLQHTLNTYAHDVLIPPNDISALLGWIGENNNVPIGDAFAHFLAADKPSLWRTLAWLIKLGIVKTQGAQGTQ